MGEAYVVRAATADDLPTLAALDERLLGGESWALAVWDEELGGLGRVLLVATSDGELVGYAIILLAGDTADLLRIGVSPEHQRRGIGSRLLAESVSRATAAGATRLLLEVSADNDDAAAFYDHWGLTEIDRRRRYYRDLSDARVLSLELPPDRSPDASVG